MLPTAGPTTFACACCSCSGCCKCCCCCTTGVACCVTCPDPSIRTL